MAARSFNYSKWDNIELSDDESDLHPNIDKDSWFRMKHRTRLEREQKEDTEMAEYDKLTAEDNIRLKTLRARLARLGAGDDEEEEDAEALQGEVDELNGRIAVREKRKTEIMQRRAWNIDNICKTKDEKSVVNTATSKSLAAEDLDDDDDEDDEPADTPEEATTTMQKPPTTAPTPTPTPSPAKPSAVITKPSPAVASTAVATAAPASESRRERFAAINYNDFALRHEALLEQYSEIFPLEDTKEFLFKHCDVLLHEHAQSYMMLSCLEDEMNGKKTRMQLVCRQSQILTHIHELGVSMRRDPRDVILPFFARIAIPQYLQGFTAAVEQFTQRIRERAVAKRAEMEASEAQTRLGPGGLDPLEVLRMLPVPLQEAFESQDIARLQQVLMEMEPKEAQKYMKMCVDSGLWVPQQEQLFENEDEFPQEEDDDEEQ